MLINKIPLGGGGVVGIGDQVRVSADDVGADEKDSQRVQAATGSSWEAGGNGGAAQTNAARCVEVAACVARRLGDDKVGLDLRRDASNTCAEPLPGAVQESCSSLVILACVFHP